MGNRRGGPVHANATAAAGRQSYAEVIRCAHECAIAAAGKRAWTALPKTELWKASPTPISRGSTTRCGPPPAIGVKDPSYKELN